MSLETLSSRAPSLPMPMIHTGTGCPRRPRLAVRAAGRAVARVQLLPGLAAGAVERQFGQGGHGPGDLLQRRPVLAIERDEPLQHQLAQHPHRAAGAGTGVIARPLARRLLRQVQRAAMAWRLRPDAARARTLAARAAPIIR